MIEAQTLAEFQEGPFRVQLVEQKDKRLGRQMVHDNRSRSFLSRATVDRSTWVSKTIRIYDPLPNPNQPIGCCTGVAKACQFNAVGNRITGKVLGLTWAMDMYSLFTTLDPFAGQYPPDDTGSSGWASAQGARQRGEGGAFRWNMEGADGVVQLAQAGVASSVGTWWYDDMFEPDSRGRIEPTGPRAGGHQYLIHGYDADADECIGLCWWGSFKRFRIRREHLNDLLMDGGDSHTQVRAQAN